MDRTDTVGKNIRRVIVAVCEELSIDVRELLGPDRHVEFVNARRLVVFYAGRYVPGVTDLRIAIELHRDRTTVFHLRTSNGSYPAGWQEPIQRIRRRVKESIVPEPAEPGAPSLFLRVGR